MSQRAGLVIVGVETHADTHTAAVIDQAGRLLGCQQFPAEGTGYASLLAWVRTYGELAQAGVGHVLLHISEPPRQEANSYAVFCS